ncbi:heparinase II/III family protein [Acidiferrimicrobium sp. IK]|nr:heparinase II/III family protein [Acidiferrimicrobium sp. IK]
MLRLRPPQVAHRLRLRALRGAEKRIPRLAAHRIASPRSSRPGWPATFEALDAPLDHGDPDEIASGHFNFLNDSRRLGDPPDWQQLDSAQLWRFHLHYFEWAWALAQSPNRTAARHAFADLWRSWLSKVRPGSGDAWAPYVASLRLWTLCSVFPTLVKGSDLEADYIRQIELHAGYVRSHLELDVGGNHLIKNLKALIGAGVFLNRADLVGAAARRLESQLAIQVLADGGHFERSPSYHCQVLGDLIDIQQLLRYAGGPTMTGLTDAIEAMRAWLGAMVGGAGEVALLNDAIPIGEARIAALRPVATRVPSVTFLAASGYIAARPDDSTVLIADVGDPCPADLPAHAHADCLSFELWVRGERWVADTGTSTYQPGERRAFERSTAAHNTVEIDGQDQTEVWGTFRAARRAKPHVELISHHANGVDIVASHDGYSRLPGSPLHRRSWTIRPGRVDILDIVTGIGEHRLTSRLHLTPAAMSACAVTGMGAAQTIIAADIAWGFGCVVEGEARVLDAQRVTLPFRIGWTVTWLAQPVPSAPSVLGAESRVSRRASQGERQ